MSLNLGNLVLNGKCHVMGILNVTPDSFYDGGKHFDLVDTQRRVDSMIKEGVKIIDVGGESTRPGSKPVTVEEELQRVIPAIEYISEKYDVAVSIDSQKAEVAKKAIEAGAHIVNDVGGLRNNDMISIISEKNIPVIIMHMQGMPENMQNNPQYEDVVEDIKEWLEERIMAAEMAGIKRSDIIVDPGIGFGKNLKHNLEILGRLDEFKGMAGGVLLGASRKSFIGMMSGNEGGDRLTGSLSAAIMGVIGGVDILRVHDIKETLSAVNAMNSL